MAEGMYSRIICNLQLYGGYQNLQYIHTFLMEPYFGLMDNLMPQMMVEISQVLNLSKGDPDTPTLSE